MCGGGARGAVGDYSVYAGTSTSVIGTILDKYEVLQKLGEGATATVYRGRHRTIGKDVAIKVLHPHLSASTRNRERFNREARAVGRLAHQNIVSILDYSGGQADDCYIVTELVEGATLLELLQEHGRLPSEIAVCLALELCAALAFAHDQGVIHRDIKPENVMVRRDGTVKLMDFGVARVLDEGSITLDGSLLGSPAYMSPQQALDQPLDGRTDLFSLGTLLFHAVTGQVPFAGTNASVILRNIIDANRPDVLELAPTVSPQLAAVIDRLLQVNPDDRPPTAQAAAEALTACLAEVGLTVEHPTINLRSFLLTPHETTSALRAHLRQTLLTQGKARLAANDHLGALQLLNRLLAIDEEDGTENAEVLNLIQSLHQPPEPERPNRRWLLAIGSGLGALGLSVGVWYATRPALPPRPHVEPPAAPEVRSPEPVETPIEEEITPLDPTSAQPSSPPPTAAATPPAPASLPPTSSRPTSSAPASVAAALPGPTAAVGTAAAPLDPNGWLSIGRTSTWADVYVDGRLVGQRGKGPTSSWVATKQAPLQLSPGEHTVTLRNPHAEPWEQRVSLSAGETRTIDEVELRRLPVHFTVNPQVPRDCRLTVGGVAYGTVEVSSSFELKEPEPGTTVVFDCPAPLGTLRETIGATSGGEDVVVPVRMPGGA